ncbi:HTH_Tnp_Tc3_2 domain-containing protein [Trichonephila clavipes]|nr:HTH_Tnp_Tc3_2 domain-containing protein [Trichonephila clavipes]
MGNVSKPEILRKLNIELGDYMVQAMVRLDKQRLLKAKYSCLQKTKERRDGSDRPRATADWEDRVIVRSAVTAPDSSLSTIRRATHTRVSTITIHRRRIERNLRSYRPIHLLPLMPVHCRARLPWGFAR